MEAAAAGAEEINAPAVDGAVGGEESAAYVLPPPGPVLRGAARVATHGREVVI